MRGGEKNDSANTPLIRLQACIERGLAATAEQRAEVEAEVRWTRAIAATVDAKAGSTAERKAEFEALQALGELSGDDSRRRQGAMMRRWARGLFAGEEEQEQRCERGERVCELPEDNYALERSFRLPKQHARHIHGRRHAGIVLVRRGATQLPTLDAHHHHPEPFTATDLRPYRTAPTPPSQRAAVRRAHVMRRARSQTQRPRLLEELETRHQGWA